MSKDRKIYLSRRIHFFMTTTLIALALVQSITTLICLVNHERLAWLIPGYVLLVVLVGAYYWGIYQPTRKMNKTLELFLAGYYLNNLTTDKFMYSPELERTIKRLQEMIDTKEIIQASKKQAEYLALQNQINPHFLYNTLEGIRGESLSVGLDNVANMTEALATFFRYTISKVDHLVTLEDELNNIDNYYIIQKYRFGDKLKLQIEYQEKEEKEANLCLLPKLTLQPIVENSIYHGIERKIGEGHLRIKIELTSKRLIITISDDGLGMSKERLSELNEKLRYMNLDYTKPEAEAKGGIAISNVNSRIKLLFGEAYGICIYSVQNSGTDVEITLPRLTEGDKPN